MEEQADKLVVQEPRERLMKTLGVLVLSGIVIWSLAGSAGTECPHRGATDKENWVQLASPHRQPNAEGALMLVESPEFVFEVIEPLSKPERNWVTVRTLTGGGEYGET